MLKTQIWDMWSSHRKPMHNTPYIFLPFHLLASQIWLSSLISQINIILYCVKFLFLFYPSNKDTISFVSLIIFSYKFYLFSKFIIINFLRIKTILFRRSQRYLSFEPNIEYIWSNFFNI